MDVDFECDLFQAPGARQAMRRDVFVFQIPASTFCMKVTEPAVLRTAADLLL
jgi:hypothetical protein